MNTKQQRNLIYMKIDNVKNEFKKHGPQYSIFSVISFRRQEL